uniref:Uncharacterized protein n=1 Tax=Avena sativa TaxID=4498 RepID=A0ACD5XBC5_AVESA
MWQPNALLLAATALCVLAAGDGAGQPLVTAITRDPATSLYTVPIKDGQPLVLDLSGPIIWSTCPTGHSTLDCNNVDCMRAHRFHPPNCPHTGYGKPDDDNPYRCKCTAHPHNPVSGDTTSGDMTRVELSANTTDGKNPLGPVSFTAVTSCAPDSMLAKLPAGAVGVAGLARSDLSFPAQVAGKQSVPNTFALCLPSVGIFGGGPFFLGEASVTTLLLAGYTPLRKFRESPGYFIQASKGISVDQAPVPNPDDAPLVIGLSSTIPYTELRPDVYRPFIEAFDLGMMVWNAKITPPPAAAPFELCYNSSKLSPTRRGYFVPNVNLRLDGGTTWTMYGVNSMVQVDRRTACFAFVEMNEGKTGYGGRAAPAMLIGGFQLERNLVVFDEENQRLGFTGLLTARGLECGQFNFTMAA